MRGVPKKLSLASKYLAILFLVFAVATPAVSLGQEASATTTPESLIGVDGTTVATATVPTTTSADTIAPSALLETDTATTTGEVLGESTTTGVEESSIEETPEPIIESPPPQPPLSVRKFERRITVDKKAVHSCEAETFRIDISGKPSAQLRIMFLRDTDAPYEMEVGGLPDGIDVTFRRNDGYRYTQGVGDRYLTLEIRNQAGSQKGNFSIPVIYTQKGTEDSSAICQINIVNQ